MDQFTETMRQPTGALCEQLIDMGVDEGLYSSAVEGGPILIRALYLYVMEEAAHA